MPLTVAGLELEILNRLGGKATQANLSAVTDGTNADLKPAIRKGLRYVGMTPADPATVADSDLLNVPAGRAETFMDACVLEALYVVWGRVPNGYDQKVESESQALHQIMDDVAAMIADYRTRVPRLNVPPTAVGQMAAGAAVPNDQFRLRCLPYPRTWPYPS